MSTAGPSFGGTFTGNTGGVGGAPVNWTNPSNAGADDSAFATCLASTSITGTSKDLIATNFGFSIPVGATINGILVEINRKVGLGQSAKDVTVKLVKGGVISGTNKADTSILWPTSTTRKSYGGSADLWGLALTDSDVNASTFGCMLVAQSVDAKGAGVNLSVDSFRITVTYTTAAGVAGMQWYGE